MHWFGGICGYLSVGLFAQDPVPLTTTLGKTGFLMGRNVDENYHLNELI